MEIVNPQNCNLEIIVRFYNFGAVLKLATLIISEKIKNMLYERIWGISPDILNESGIMVLSPDYQNRSEQRLYMVGLSDEAKDEIKANPHILKIDELL